MNSLIVNLDTLNDTLVLGERVAKFLQRGDAVLLFGDLGVGKTSLARSMIFTLTGETDIPSPTFTLVQTYETQDGFLVMHSDLYRINHEDEIDELGLDEAFDQGAVLIEWPERAPDWRPLNRLEIWLEDTGANQRRSTLKAFGNWADRLIGLKGE